jgi:hypothetical protein
VAHFAQAEIEQNSSPRRMLNQKGEDRRVFALPTNIIVAVLKKPALGKLQAAGWQSVHPHYRARAEQ